MTAKSSLTSNKAPSVLEATAKKVRRLKKGNGIQSRSVMVEKKSLEPEVVVGKSSPSEGPDVEPPVSSLRTEFGLEHASFVEARKSIIKGYVMMVLAPTILLLVMISLLSAQGTAGAGSLIRSMEYMLTVVAVMGIPVLIVFWANGLYPKGSYGRFISYLVLASLLVVWLVYLLLKSNLQNALADFGAALQLNKVLVLVCLTAAFAFGQAVSEFLDNRKTWMKSIGATVEVVPLNLKSMFVDFDPRIGTFSKGNSSAVSAYVRMLVIPTLLLVVIDWLIDEMDLVARDAIVASVSSMFGTVILFGIVLVLVHLVRGFYPSGSFGHVTAGLARVPVLFIFAWEILINSGIQEAFAQNYFLIDMYDVMIPVVMYVAFITVFELSELADCRRSWYKEIGMPVDPYLPEKRYSIVDDFRLRYVSFVNGAKKGVKILNKYAFRRILIFTIIGAVVVSLLEYAGGVVQYSAVQDMIDNVESAFVGWINQWIQTLLILSILLTTAYFFAWSYRAGSFSRLVLTWMVSVLNALWAYYLWGAAARSTDVSYIVLVFNLVMFVFIAIAGITAVLAIGVYTRQRKAYLSWRSLMLSEEAEFVKRRSTAGVPVPTTTSPGPMPIETLGFLADLRSSTFFFEGIPARTSVLSAGSYSFDVASADKSGSIISREPPVRRTLRQDAAIMTSTKASRGLSESIMASYMAVTKKPASKVIERAAEHFGAFSGGLMVKSKTDTSLRLEGPDGFVAISVCPSKSNGKRNEVDIETCQFDRQVREFLSKL